MSKKELLPKLRFYNKLNHLNIISKSKILPLKQRKFIWYQLYSKKIIKKTTMN